MSKEQVSSGESFQVTVLDRAYSGKETAAFTVHGGNLANPVTGVAATAIGTIEMNAPVVNLNGSPVISQASIYTLVVNGVAAAGPITAAGTKVGDKIVQAMNETDSLNGAANFETTISVAGQIQQLSASNLTTKLFSILLVSKG